ncbi:MAG: efflux RND transporter permease subunit, partial [Proteobacteria bacterium]|nr:efflux RND transporter permease subunit [Pseudomonadota bacterium]
AQIAKFNGKTSAAIGISLSPGSNAMETAKLVKDRLASMRGAMPVNFTYSIVYDTSEFVSESIHEVVKTLEEAMILVVIVVFVFLQGFRTTLIPMLAVPVSLIATMIVYQWLGFSINTLSLFGLVLAIGIVVDDAIVVVEAVEHKMEAESLDAKSATREAMNEVSGPVVAIALVLSAVFVPMAFVPGVTGQLYKQFALTIAVSTMFSALVALTLTPALCSILLKPKDKNGPKNFIGRFFDGFNRGFARLTDGYVGIVRLSTSSLRRVVMVMVLVVVGIYGVARITPTGFVPDEDVGAFFMQTILPDASNGQRTQQVLDGFEGKMRQLPGVESVLSINGFDVLSGTAAPNGGLMIVKLKPWGERGKDESAAALIAEANKMAFMVPQAISFAFGPPALPGFGASSGFSMLIQAKGSQTSEDLARMTQAFVAEAGKNPAIGRVTSVFSASTPSYELTVDREKAKSLGVSLADISTTLQVALGSLEVNDFSRYGRNYRVILQADAPYREDIGAIDYLKVRNSLGQMVPLNTLVTVKPSHGPRFTTRYNLYKSAELTGAPAPGYSSGQALAALEATAAKVLTPDYGYAWSGQTLEEVETGNSAIIVMALSVVVVFLFLAALYESWSIPIAVLLGVPFGVLGAYLFLLMRGLDFNVYGQIGVVTLVGLSAKNAILIVEFAKLYREQGKPIVEAAIEAARLRLRPILMTSFAFILGIVPLYIASGAGAASKHSVGTVVFGGMLLATSMAVIMVPALYVIVQTLTERWTGRKDVAAPGEGTAPPAANDLAAEGA